MDRGSLSKFGTIELKQPGCLPAAGHDWAQFCRVYKLGLLQLYRSTIHQQVTDLVWQSNKPDTGLVQASNKPYAGHCADSH